MLFNSLDFLIFFPVVTILYFLIPHRFRWSMLLTASCIFYMTFVPYYILILFFTITVDYFAGILIEKAKDRKSKKKLLIISLIANIGVLAFFKYYNFLNLNLTSFLGLFDAKNPVPALDIILPIGLSFHTFQSMSYTIEIYRGNFKAEKNFGIFSLYVMFYPQLVAGPIERPQNVLPQLHTKHSFNVQRTIEGLTLMLWGFVKKVVIADRLTIYVDQVFADPESFASLNLLLAVYFFSFQIYCDFSGYTDIAIGAAKILGIDLMKNFGRPYFSKSIREFWSRWHISLSSWFRDYLYIPLGGNRVRFSRACFNIAVVFLISGLWHGANWTYVIWGAIHMVYIIAQMFFDRWNWFKKGNTTLTGKIFYTLVVFNLVSLAWIFFRAESIDSAFAFIERLFSPGYNIPFTTSFVRFNHFSMLLSAFVILLMMAIEYFTSYDLKEITNNKTKRAVFSAACIILIISLGVFSGQTFIYFQF